MDLPRLVEILRREGPGGAFPALARARASAGADPARLDGIERILTLEATALASWRRTREEPAFGLQQLRNQALACGIAPVLAEAEAALAALGKPWLAEVAPPEPGASGLLRCLRGAPGEGVSPLSPDGRCSLNRSGGTLELRDLETGALVASYALGSGALVAAGGRLLVVSGRVELRDLVSGRSLLAAKRRGTRNVAVSATRRLVAFGEGRTRFGGFDGEFSGGSSSVELWDAMAGARRWKREVYGGDGRMVGFGPTGRHLLFANEVLRVSDGERVCGVGRSAVFTPDGGSVVGIGGIREAEEGDHRHAIHVTSLRDGSCREIPMEGQLEAFALSPDGAHLLAAARGEARLGLWELATGRELWTLRLDAARLLFLPRGPIVAARDTFALVDPSSGELLGTAEGHPREITAMAGSADGRFLATSDDHEVRVWSPEAIRRSASSRTLAVREVLLTADGARALVVDRATRLARIEERGLVEERTLETGAGSVALSPDGASLLTVDRGGALVRFALEDGARASSRGIGSGRALASYSPDGRWIAIRDGEELRLLPADPGPRVVGEAGGWSMRLARPIVDLAFSPDGRLVAVSDGDGASLLDGATGRLLIAARGAVDRVAVSDDGFLVVAGRQHAAAVWQLDGREASASGKATSYLPPAIAPGGRFVLSERSGMVTVEERQPGAAALVVRGEILARAGTAVFAGDGETFGTATAEEGLTLWHLPRLRRIARVWLPRGGHLFALSRDAGRVVMVDRDGRAHLYRLERRLPGGRPARPRSRRA